MTVSGRRDKLGIRWSQRRALRCKIVAPLSITSWFCGEPTMRTRPTLLAALLLGVFTLTPAPAQPPPAGAQPAKPPGLDVVPTDSFGFFTVNVAKLWDNPNFKPLREWLSAQKVGPTDDVLGVPPAELDRLTVFMPFASADPLPGVVVTTRKPYNEAKVLKALKADRPGAGNSPPGPGRVGNAVRLEGGQFRIVVLLDERTLLYFPEMGHSDLEMAALLGQLVAKKTDGPLTKALADAAEHDFAVAFDTRPFAAVFELADDPKKAPYHALLKAQTATFAANFDKTARLTFKLAFADAEAAKRAAPVLKEAGAELATLMGKELDSRKGQMDATERFFLESAVTALKAANVEMDGSNVFALAEVPYQDAVAKLAAALPKSYSAAVSSARGLNNLKQLALAMHNYNAAMGYFPSDVAPGGDKPPAMSWRVQILPYIEQQNLYQQVNMQKPWDDPANLKVLEKMEMPKVFEIPGRPAPKGYTYFRMFSLPKNAKGKDRPWLVEGERGPTVSTITDGFSNTLMIVEAGEAVPWYKPDVLAYDGVLPLPQLGDKNTKRFIVAFGDGSTRLLQRDKLDEKTLRALITAQGGEVIKLP
jgi:hypothetical protein